MEKTFGTEGQSSLHELRIIVLVHQIVARCRDGENVFKVS